MEDSVSEFIVGTCRIIPKLYADFFDPVYLESMTCDNVYRITCGSTAEFFVQPLHSCISDVDELDMRSNFLAFTDEKPVLPYDMRYVADRVCCYVIEPYDDYPSFVRLRHFGDLRYNWSRKVFKFVRSDSPRRTLFDATVRCSTDLRERFIAGPALKHIGTYFGSHDQVASIHCPQWPKEAKEWPHRRRKYDCPTNAIIEEAVQNGCNVVFAKHPLCRNDIHQCRLSFSFAEVILLQNWTKIQQIAYHMLRFFAKKEVIKKGCPKEDEVLCCYHLKTLMLWSCEQMPSEWWMLLSVIEICCLLLQKLVIWLKQKKIPNYFIPKANLFHEHFNHKLVDETVETLIRYCDTDILSLWFVEHYMRPVYPYVVKARCKHDALKYVNKYLLQTCRAMKEALPNTIDTYFSLRFPRVVDNAHDLAKAERIGGTQFSKACKYRLRTASSLSSANGFPLLTESCFSVYMSMMHILQAAHSLECEKIHYGSEIFVEVIRRFVIKPKSFRSRHHNFPRPFETGISKNQLLFIKAQDIMGNLTGPSDSPEFKFLSQMSSNLLRKALECKDSEVITDARAISAYMAGLHFASSEYKTVKDICSRLVANQNSDKDNKEILNAGCLFYIDDIVKINGFYLIFRQIKDNLNNNRKWMFLDLRLTPEVFARYLFISSAKLTYTYAAFGYDHIFQTYQTSKFPLDAMLITLATRKCSGLLQNADAVSLEYKRFDPVNKVKEPSETCLPKEDDIVQLLIEVSLIKMTSFYKDIFQDFGIHCSTVDCYRAAYLYQRRKYPEVVDLCERILSQPEVDFSLKEITFVNVMVFPPLDLYFDTDIRCLLGLDTLVRYLSPLNEDLLKIEYSSEWTFDQIFASIIYSEKSLLSKVLLDCNYKLTCHYFLGRYFLARYLKVRCLLDYCNSLSDAIFEFKDLKPSLPFEHAMHCFLQQKLRQLNYGPKEKYLVN